MNLVLQQNRALRFLFVCAMYLAQGIPYGFVTIALKNHLIDLEFSTGDVGNSIAILSLPWTFKFLFGPLIDRFASSRFGRRRPWILAAQIMMLATIAAMLAVDVESQGLVLLTWLIFAHNIFAALQDVSTDALAIDLIPAHERGKANGLMYGCAYVGRYFGGYAVGMVLSSFSMAAALGVQVLLLGVLFLLPLFVVETAGSARFPWSQGFQGNSSHNIRFGPLLLRLFQAFRKPLPIVGAIVAIASQLGGSALAIVGAAYLQRTVGWSKDAYVTLESFTSWAGFFGSLIAGIFIDKIGGRRMVMALTVAYGSTWLLWFALQSQWSSQPVVYALMITETGLQGALSVSLFAWFMNLCDKRIAATHFTAYMGLLNFSIFIGGSIAGPIEKYLGFPRALLAFAAFQSAIFLIPWLAGKGSGDFMGPGAFEENIPDPAPEAVP